MDTTTELTAVEPQYSDAGCDHIPFTLIQFIQSRAQVDKDLISQYAEDMQRGDKFPPARACYDGSIFWVYNGYHRGQARQQLKEATLLVEWERGNKDRAVRRSWSANHDNGLRRTNADKQKVVTEALRVNPEWSNARIADLCCVSLTMVLNLRNQLIGQETIPTVTERLGRDGKIRKQKTESKQGVTNGKMNNTAAKKTTESELRYNNDNNTDNEEVEDRVVFVTSTLVEFRDKLKEQHGKDLPTEVVVTLLDQLINKIR